MQADPADGSDSETQTGGQKDAGVIQAGLAARDEGLVHLDELVGHLLVDPLEAFGEEAEVLVAIGIEEVR